MARLLRSAEARVTNIELFFDLVYVFAVTQLAHVIEAHTSIDGAIRTAVLLAMMWQVWVYTTWFTNYFDPNRSIIRLTLVAIMAGSLVMAAALPEAFGDRGWLVAILFVVMQVGRSGVGIPASRGHELQRTFVRLASWSVLGAVPMLVGASAGGHAREVLWALAVLVELGGAAWGFPVPGLGHADTHEWTIDGGHFAERCQAFVLIALGESIVVVGATLADAFGHPRVDATVVTSFVLAFLGTVALWWVYFDRSTEDSVRMISESDDPGRIGRSAFHWVHPVIVAGIIVSAASDEAVLHDPTARGVLSTAWLLLGGVALYLAGHAIFKAIVWHHVSWSRIVAVVVLIALLALAPHVTAIVTGVCVLVVTVAVVIADRLRHAAAQPGDDATGVRSPASA